MMDSHYLSSALENKNLVAQLKAHAQSFQQLHLRDLFQQDPHRFGRFSLEADNLFFDYSKNLLSQETLPLLLQLIYVSQLEKQIDRLFTGAIVNTTEHRAAMHTALRNTNAKSLFLDGKDISAQINQTLEKMNTIVTQLHQQQWPGFSEKPITDVVNIGIGGSDLGPAMATRALTPYHQHRVRCHFVSNVDKTDLADTLKALNPETTLFIVASKSFTTQETLCNADSAKKWLQQACDTPALLIRHFIAITGNTEKAMQLGFHHILPIWEWVGGRFSLWSSIGLSVAIAIGMNNFKKMLEGAKCIDDHFRSAPFQQNMPVIHALLTIWYVNFFHVRSYAILPYCAYLKLFPAYLQQLEMESNGKNCQQNGLTVSHATSPIIWGEVGSNGQHAFHQLLHQGTQLVPIDFILPLRSRPDFEDHHAWLVANCLSQSRALMLGKTREEIKKNLERQSYTESDIAELLPHKEAPGNRPSNTLLIPELTPSTLGSLLAHYEHKTFVQSVIWGINCFDQWGVELGKQLTSDIFNQLTATEKSLDHLHDSSTQGLINRYKRYY